MNLNAHPYYVVDTDVLLKNPAIFSEIEAGTIVIVGSTIAELEISATAESEYRNNAQTLLRYLKKLQEEGILTEGVRVGPQVFFKVIKEVVSEGNTTVVPCAVALAQEGHPVTILSNTCTTRMQAQAAGVTVQSYYSRQCKKDFIYKGWKILAVPAIQLKQEIPEALEDLMKEGTLTMNEYVIVESQHNPYNYRVFRYTGSATQVREVGQVPMSGSVVARNVQQLMAFDALFDPSISLVTLLGPAGTGKTLLSLFAGLEQTVHNDEYQRVFVARPVVPLGRDIGYLPGDLHEKMHLWMQPVYDTIGFIMRSQYNHHHLQHIKQEHALNAPHPKKNKMPHKKEKLTERSTLVNSVEDLIEQDKITLEAITYMRGRSLAHQFIIIDEVQNLTLHEIKTIISRVGHHSKIILCGDPEQIDSPFLDFFNNGLTIVNQKFKGQSLYATVWLEYSERSELSRLAAALL